MRVRCLLLITVSALAISPAARGQVDPEARKLLEDMTRAFRSLRSLEMTTVYSGDTGGFSKPVRARLVMRRPNRLLYEVWQDTPGLGRSTVKRYLCDGKKFYIYDEAQGYYTQDPAPRDFRSLSLAGAGLEYAMAAGASPFGDLERQVRAARLEGQGEVDGEPVDIVLLDSGTSDRTAEARLYISRSTRLLRRFSFESVWLKKPGRSEPAEAPLDPDGEEEPDQEIQLLPVRFHYDNSITPNARIPDTVFTWTVPKGALLYEPYARMVSPDRYKGRPSYQIIRRDGKRQKPLTYRDLVEQARKTMRRRK